MSFIRIPVQMNLIKAHGEKDSGPFSFERSATSPPQADHVLVVFSSSVADRGAALKPPDSKQENKWNLLAIFKMAFIYP